MGPKTAAMSIQQVIQSEQKLFAQLQWTIYSSDQVSLVLKYSNTPVIITEPIPQEEKKEEKKEEIQQQQQHQMKKRVKKKVKKIRKVKKPKQGEQNTNEPGAVTTEKSNKGNDDNT